MERESNLRKDRKARCMSIAKRFGIFTLLGCLGVIYVIYTNIIKEVLVPMDGGKHVLVQINSYSPSKEHSLQSATRQIHSQISQDSTHTGYMTERLQQVRENCHRYNIHTSGAIEQLRKYLNMDVLFCGVPKTSTKFWKLLLGKLNTEETFYLFNGTHSSKNVKTGRRNGDVLNQKDSTYKITFTRDPYSRIFSSYLDKFLAPNPAFFNLARKIISFSRDGAPPDCPIDVHFREVIQFLNANDPRTFDRHFKPVSIVCDVCNVEYTAIGKAETFKRDVMQILDNLNAANRVKVRNFTEEGNVFTMIQLVYRTNTLMKKQQARHCMTPYTWHQRLWRAFQIYGWIDKANTFPWTKIQSASASIPEVSNLLLQAYHNASITTKANKQEALIQAYNQISRDELEQLRRKYLNDFLLFDYEDRPAYLFNRSDDDKVTFDFFDVL